MNRAYRHIIFCLLMLAFGAPLSALPMSAKTGLFEFSEHHFDTDGYVSLAGPWELYPNQLLKPGQFTSTAPRLETRVPGSWSQHPEVPLLGYATYRCRVILNQDQKGLLLYISMINASSRVWINGVKRGATGLVDAHKDEYKPELKNTYIPLPEYTDTLEIVVQATNYAYFSSGIVGTPLIGRTADLIHEKNEKNGIENFFAGSLFAMFIYQILLFFLYSRGKPNLWLALICLVVAIRSMTLNGGSFLLPNLFPAVPFELWKKIEFGGVYLVVALFPLYIHHLFKSTSSRLAIRFFVFVALSLVAAVVVAPQYRYGQLLDVCHVALVLTFPYAIITVLKAWTQKKNPDAKFIFFGVIISCPFIILEILKNTALVNLPIRFGYLVELGLLVFLIFQVYTLARHYANSYKSLEVINRELEAEISQRTHDLVDSNKIKDRLLSIISHDVKSPLNNLRGLLSLHDISALPPKEFNQFIKQIDENLSSTNSMVENILFWTARQRKGEKVKIEKVNLRQIVKDNISQMQSIAHAKSLKLEHNLEQDLFIQSDRGIVDFTIRNLLANAIKFSHKNDSIQIQIKSQSPSIVLTVEDHGIGMSQAQIKKLFDNKQAESTQGTADEKGTGLGLNLAKDYLSLIQGELHIKSVEGKGSTFEIHLPMEPDNGIDLI